MYSFIYPINRKDGFSKVCLLVHGLNFNPDSMFEIANEFLKHSYIICFVRLTGHSKDSKLSSYQLKKVTDKDWLNDLEEAYLDVITNFRNHEIIFCGYSLGGLLGLVFQNRKNSFASMILLSPAISTVWYTKLLHLIAFTRHFGFSIHGKIPPQHRACRSTPLQAYHALSRLLRSFRISYNHVNFSSSNIIVCCHTQDELVSHRGVSKFINEETESSWKMVELDSKVLIKHLFISSDMYFSLQDWEAFNEKLNTAISQI